MMQLDIQSIARLPFKKQWPLALLLTVLMGIAGYVLFINSLLDETKVLEQQEISLKESYVDKKRQALNLVALEQQLQDIEVGFSELLKQLPTHVKVDDFINEITEIAGEHGVHVISIRPEAEHAKDAGGLIEIPLQVQLSGSYNNIAGMMGDFGGLARIVSTEQVRLIPSDDARKISVQAVIKTFRTHEQGVVGS